MADTHIETPLKDEGTAVLVGLLADGSVAGQINVQGSSAGRSVVSKKEFSGISLKTEFPEMRFRSCR